MDDDDDDDGEDDDGDCVNFAEFRNALRGTLKYLSYLFAVCEFC